MLRSPLAILLCVLAVVLALAAPIFAIPGAAVAAALMSWVLAVILEAIARGAVPSETAPELPVHRDPELDEPHI